jgi:hypothetical protein
MGRFKTGAHMTHMTHRIPDAKKISLKAPRPERIWPHVRHQVNLVKKLTVFKLTSYCLGV